MIKTPNGRVYQHALSVSLVARPPYDTAAQELLRAPTHVSNLTPRLRTDKPRVFASTPLEHAILGNP